MPSGRIKIRRTSTSPAPARSTGARRNGVMFGVMAVDFGDPHTRQDLESRLPLLTTIADQCTLALDRARLIERERMARSDVEVALKAADRASQDKSAFLAEFSHEVQTPLH